ncbi:MAG TPA: ATP-binding domain-containing protein, partial [Syntrophaceticus sp.]|nr:ATP-binding domain-containing protein [Syntrophaceticus sp.]
ILNVANALISHNRGRKPKELWTSNKEGEPIYFYQAFDEKDEARFIGDTIRAMVSEGVAEYRDCAVFYRTHSQSRPIEEECIRSGIPYRIYGGQRFYERKEIKDILAYLRVVANPADELSLRRIINVPRRGIGDTTIARVEEAALRTGRTFADVLSHPESADLGARAVVAIKGFFQLVNSWRALDGAMPIANLVEKILDDTGYLVMLKNERTIEAETRLENIKEFLVVAQQYDSAGTERSLAGFLEELALVTDIDNYQPSEDAVVLMTIHSAKGMEFPVVFLTGMEEGLFPHAHALDEEAELEEERRLCYVGITRAMKKLYLSRAIRRSSYSSIEFREPSRFLYEIPEDYLCPVAAGGGVHAVVAAVGEREQSADHALMESSAGKEELAAVTAPQEKCLFKVGEKVEHKKFGRGVVMETKIGPGGDQEIFVSFETAGFKHLLAKYAPLKKL